MTPIVDNNREINKTMEATSITKAIGKISSEVDKARVEDVSHASNQIILDTFKDSVSK